MKAITCTASSTPARAGNNSLKKSLRRCHHGSSRRIPWRWWLILAFLPFLLRLPAQEKHIYLANDNHTDYFWSGNAQDYTGVALNEIGYYLNLADATDALDAPYQSRYNLDGAWYAYTYRQHKSPAEFERLISRIRSGHISIPYNFFVSTYGGQPTEAILRGMYWPGWLEREYNLDISLAVAMENQTLPLGLASLWAGSGARYSWKGVCGCNSPVDLAALRNRSHEIYRYRGIDGSEVPMKWFTLIDNPRLGGYGEARNPATAVNDCEARLNTGHYPFSISAAFGYGMDDVQTTTDIFVQTAQSLSNASRQVYVSNEYDFFQHFLSEYDINTLPVETRSYGNDWDMDCEAMAAVTSEVRRSVEKLRSAEALASLVSAVDTDFYPAESLAREAAWVALGSFWEHNFGLGGCCDTERGNWQIELQQQVSSYTDGLYEASLDALARAIHNPSPTNMRFVVFNPLGWQRGGYADVEYSGSNGIKVIELLSGQEAPHQLVEREGAQYLRIFAEAVPSAGYKVYEVRPGTGEGFPNAASLNGNVFENAFYRLSITSQGAITSIIDKRNGNAELVEETNGRFLNDFGQAGSQGGALELLNNGPVSATAACSGNNPLQHTTLITLYAHTPRIDIDNRINDEFGNGIRTYSFSFGLDNPTLWHEELGAILKAKYTTNGGHYAPPGLPIRHEWQSLNHFADIGNAQRGVTLSNLGAGFMKLGNSSLNFLDENSAQVNVLIGGQMGGSGPGFANQFGMTDFRHSFALQSRTGAFHPAQAMKFALEHQNPLIATAIRGEERILPDTAFSLLQVSSPNVLLWALKPSEEGMANGGLILRLWNLDTLGQENTVRFASEVLSAERATHLETGIAPIPPEQGALAANIGRQRMETFRVFPDALSFYCSTASTITETICEGETFEGYTASGTYSDTLSTANGCDSIRTIELTVLPADRVNVELLTCDSLLAGTHIDTLFNQNGCDSIVTTINTFVPLEYTIYTTDVTCFGFGNGSIVIESAVAYDITWADGFTGNKIGGLGPGAYAFSLLEPISGCWAEDSAIIQSPSELLANLVTGPASSGTSGDGSAAVSPAGGQPPYTVLWSTGDNGTAVDSLAPGAYSVTLSDANGCADTLDFEITIINSISGIPTLLSFELYPNPASEELHLELQFRQREQGEIILYSLPGRELYREHFEGMAHRSAIPAGRFPAGIYRVQVVVGRQAAVKTVAIE